MVTAGIKEARQHLTEYLAKVERGEEVIITRRNEPVARPRRSRAPGQGVLRVAESCGSRSCPRKHSPGSSSTPVRASPSDRWNSSSTPARWLNSTTPKTGARTSRRSSLRPSGFTFTRLCMVEMASALARKQRDGMIDKGAETRLWNAFRDDLRSAKVATLPLDEEVTDRAAALVRDLGAQEGLRALDALQLAPR